MNFLSGLLPQNFTSSAMDERNRRLATARTQVQKNIKKDMKKDRRDLEKRERELVYTKT
jgi:hypothetical protein